MYATYFGLSENPFNMTPDHKYLYLSHHHREAIDHLLYGIHERKGFIAIWGGIGTGKTTLCRALLNHLEPHVKTALVFNTALSDIELLETINQEFGIETPDGASRTQKAHLDRLNRFLLDNHRKNGNAVLILDEAQNLSADSLEQLRMISNLETETEKLIQIVLVGQPELRELLESPSLAQLNERITVRYVLRPLAKKEVSGYIDHRLVVAGGRGKIHLKKSAVGAVFAHSNGNPRRINAICDRALLIAYCKDEFAIGSNTIRRAVNDVRGKSNGDETGRRIWTQRRLTQLAAVIVVVFVMANILGWNVRAWFSPFMNAAEKITAVQAKAFFNRPEHSKNSSPLLSEQHVFRKEIMAPVTQLEQAGENWGFNDVDTEKGTDLSELAMDDRASLSVLLQLYDVKTSETEGTGGNVQPGLFAFKGDPELYRTFVRPFRVRVKAGKGQPREYLVIKEVTPEGAIGVDIYGTERLLTDAFLLAHWAGEMSWVYPFENVSGVLSQGMSGLSVLKIQQMLQNLGYDVEPRGIYNQHTFEEVMRFQLNQGLGANGIVDTDTKALLYQMTS